MARVAFAEHEIDTGERIARRARLMLLASLRTEAAEPSPVTIYDLSETGLLMECGRRLAVGSPATLEDAKLGTRPVEIVWGNGDFYGCRFVRPLEPQLVSAAFQASPVVWPAFREEGIHQRQAPLADTVPARAQPGLTLGQKALIVFALSVALWLPIVALLLAL